MNVDTEVNKRQKTLLVWLLKKWFTNIV